MQRSCNVRATFVYILQPLSIPWSSLQHSYAFMLLVLCVFVDQNLLNNMIFHVIFPPEKSIRQKWGRGDPFFIKIKYNCVVPYASESVTANIHRPSHLFFYGRHSTFVLNKKVLCEKFYFFLEINVPFYLSTSK